MKVDEIKNLVPVDKVYEDAIRPAMQQIGKTLESVVKVSMFLFAPLEYLANYRERWERYLKKVSDKVREEDLVEGHPQLVVPILQGLSLVHENTLVGGMFINLLANSIDKTRQSHAHPAFPSIINQLSHDEAVVLFFLKKKGYGHRHRSDFNEEETLVVNRVTVEEEFPIEKLQFPDLIWVYIDHLHSLNLAGSWQVGQQEVIRNPINNKQTGVFVNTEKRLSDFGQLFAKSCVPDEFEGL